MYLWRRLATPHWWTDNEEALRAIAGNRLAVIERPDRKRIELEVASRSHAKLQTLGRKFGGRVEKLRRDWLKRSLRRKTQPIHIGNKKLSIPAGAAFGTGEHATTSMCLARLKQIVRAGDVVIDLGTGSGILALAARLLGAKRVIAIDSDPTAIRVAKENARLNKIDNVTFRIGDVRHWRFPRKIDVVAANLFSELLVEILPRLKHARRLILSGLLREQECDVRRALTRNKIDIVEVQRRGKWVAILARCG
jgi:ribosomal protein L11 methyltransferase